MGSITRDIATENLKYINWKYGKRSLSTH
jgi:hypothetical protein